MGLSACEVPRFYSQGFDIISWAPLDSISDPRGCRPLGTKEEVEGLTGRELWKHRAIRSKPWKYVVNWHQEKGANFQLFNLEKDPGEVENMISGYPDLTQHFVDILRRCKFSHAYGIFSWTRLFRNRPGDHLGEASSSRICLALGG